MLISLCSLLKFQSRHVHCSRNFKNAIGQFQSTKKPFIYTYFKTPPPDNADPSLAAFEAKLKELKHFYAGFNNFDDLWNQFNKELERLEADGFTENKRPDNETPAKTINQTADKIYNIEKIDTANFS